MASVVTTPDADENIEFIDTWWREQRRAAPELFRVELREAFERLARSPEIGLPLPGASEVRYRRLLLPRTRNHVYYCVVDGVVEVLAVMGAVRGAAPRFPR